MIRIAKYAPEDRAEVRRICFETGFLGRPLHGIVDNRDFFLDLATHYYLDVEPAGIFVAKDGAAVAGYILVRSKMAAFEALERNYFILRSLRQLFRFWQFSRKDVRYYLGYLLSYLRGEFRYPVFEEYPAVLHINVSAECHGKGVGNMLFDAMFSYLKEQNCPGVQLRTTSENANAFTFFTKHGFRTLASNESNFYTAFGYGKVHNVLMGRKLSND